PRAARRARRIDEHVVVRVVQIRAGALIQKETGRVGRRTDVSHEVLATGEVEGPAALSGRSRLCEYLNDAAGRFGSVQRRRRGALDDLDALDVVGLDVVDGECALPRVRRERTGVAVDADAIDVHDRRVALRETVRAAQANRPPGARLAGVPH